MPSVDSALPLALLSGPRRRIVALLRTRERTIPELARELAVSPNAVRSHLAALGRDGLVSGGYARRGDAPGKPPTLYGLTAAAEELFPRGYGALLLAVFDLLCEWDGAEAPAELLRAAGARAADAEGATGPDAAARVLARLGAEVTLVRAGGEAALSASGCPLAGAVLERPELCRWVAALMGGACGGAAAEACDRSGGRPRCRFTLASTDSRT